MAARAVAAALGALAVAGALAACWLSRGDEAQAPAATPAASPATTSPLPGVAGDAFGINEAVSVPAAAVKRLTPDQQRAELAGDAALTKGVGARIVRANSHTFPYLNFQAWQKQGDPWVYADLYVRALLDSGLDAVVVLGPWPGIQTGNHTRSYLPPDMAAYAAFVRQVVERYDADGADDMPGLTRKAIVAWEVDNEPDLHNSVPPRGAKVQVDPSTFETPAEYAAVLLATAAAIREADAGAFVLSGGMYNPRSPSGRRYLDTVLATPGVRQAISGLSLHCYKDDDSLDGVDETIRAWQETAPDLPLWITEIGVPADGRKPWMDEAWQARMVAGVYGAALAGGASRVFWHTIADPPPDNGRNSPFASHSLHRSIGSSWAGGSRERKPSGEVYARLAERLAGVPRDRIAARPAAGGRLLQAGDALLAYWGRPEVPPGRWQAEDLRTGQAGPAGERVTAPAWLTPL